MDAFWVLGLALLLGILFYANVFLLLSCKRAFGMCGALQGFRSSPSLMPETRLLAIDDIEQ